MLIFDILYIIFLNSNGTCISHQKISATSGNFTAVLDPQNHYNFGMSVSDLGDLDQDGHRDVIVGADSSDDNSGSVFVIFLNSNGKSISHQKIASTVGNFYAELTEWNSFGCSVSAIEDLNNDGIQDAAVGADYNTPGHVYIIFLNLDGTCLSHQVLNDADGDFTGVLQANGYFGTSITTLTDLNGDGIKEIAVGSHDLSGRGAVYVFLSGNLLKFLI